MSNGSYITRLHVSGSEYCSPCVTEALVGEPVAVFIQGKSAQTGCSFGELLNNTDWWNRSCVYNVVWYSVVPVALWMAVLAVPNWNIYQRLDRLPWYFAQTFLPLASSPLLELLGKGNISCSPFVRHNEWNLKMGSRISQLDWSCSAVWCRSKECFGISCQMAARWPDCCWGSCSWRSTFGKRTYWLRMTRTRLQYPRIAIFYSVTHNNCLLKCEEVDSGRQISML